MHVEHPAVAVEHPEAPVGRRVGDRSGVRSRISIWAPCGKSVVTRASSTHGIASSSRSAASVSTRSTVAPSRSSTTASSGVAVGVHGALHVDVARWRTATSRARRARRRRRRPRPPRRSPATCSRLRPAARVTAMRRSRIRGSIRAAVVAASRRPIVAGAGSRSSMNTVDRAGVAPSLPALRRASPSRYTASGRSSSAIDRHRAAPAARPHRRRRRRSAAARVDPAGRPAIGRSRRSTSSVDRRPLAAALAAALARRSGCGLALGARGSLAHSAVRPSTLRRLGTSVPSATSTPRRSAASALRRARRRSTPVDGRRRAGGARRRRGDASAPAVGAQRASATVGLGEVDPSAARGRLVGRTPRAARRAPSAATARRRPGGVGVGARRRALLAASVVARRLRRRRRRSRPGGPRCAARSRSPSATRPRTASITARTSVGRAAVGGLDEVGVLLRHPRRADAQPAQAEPVDRARRR